MHREARPAFQVGDHQCPCDSVPNPQRYKEGGSVSAQLDDRLIATRVLADVIEKQPLPALHDRARDRAFERNRLPLQLIRARTGGRRDDQLCWHA